MEMCRTDAFFDPRKMMQKKPEIRTKMEERGSQDLSDLIIGILNSQHDVRSVDISKQLSVTKRQVNRILYDMQNKGIAKRSVSNPPRWNSCHKKIAPPCDEITYVLVDLGNFHTTLFEEIDKKYEHVRMIGFADVHYNGQKPEKTFRAKEHRPNAADIILMTELVKIWTQKPGSEIVVCSKDKFFSYAPILSKQYGCRTYIAKNIEELKMCID